MQQLTKRKPTLIYLLEMTEPVTIKQLAEKKVSVYERSNMIWRISVIG